MEALETKETMEATETKTEPKPKRKTHTSTAVKARYNAKAYDRIAVCVPKGKKDILQAHAAKNGESLNAFIVRAIREVMERETN